MSRWNSRRASLRFREIGGAGLFVDVGPGPGDFSMDNIKHGNVALVQVKDRGQHDGFVPTDDLVQACSITIQLENKSITHATEKRVLDWINRTGAFAGAALTDGAWLYEAVYTMTDGTTTSTIVLPEIEGETAMAEAMEGSSLNISFRNYRAPTFA